MSNVERRRARKVFGGYMLWVGSAVLGAVLMIREVYPPLGLFIMVTGSSLGGMIIREGKAKSS